MTAPAVFRGACPLLFLIPAVLATGPARAQTPGAPIPLRPPLNIPRPPFLIPYRLTTVDAVRDALSQPLTVDEVRRLESMLFQYRNRGAVRPEYVLLMLEQEAAQGTTANARWAAIQSLRGYGGYATAGFNVDANEAYLALFKAPFNPEVGSFISQALTDYLVAVTTVPLPELINRNPRAYQYRFYSERVYDGTSSPEVLRAALNAYLSSPPQSSPQDYQWAKAARVVECWNEIRQELETRLATTTDSGPRLRLLRMLVPFYAEQNPARALELVTEAETLTPPLGLLDTEFQERHIALLIAQNGLREAIQCQAAWTQRSRSGYKRLLELMIQAGDTEGIQRVIADLQQTGINTRAIYEAIQALNRPLSLPGVSRKDAIRQLSMAFLNAKMGRDLNEEVNVRLILARLLYEDQKRDAALRVLDDLVIPTSLSRPFLGDQYKLLHDTRDRMAAGTFCDA